MSTLLESALGQPLRSSNLLSSATLTCKYTQHERRQDCLDVEICLSFRVSVLSLSFDSLSFVSVLGHETLFLRPQGGAPIGSPQPFRLVTDIPDPA